MISPWQADRRCKICPFPLRVWIHRKRSNGISMDKWPRHRARFLSHLTENGRVIGIFAGTHKGTRHSGAEDLEICVKVLSRLHGPGIWHGDTNRFKFLVRGEKAVFIDYDTARKSD
ncbi:hypothetical protein BJX65DRAFT_276143 [Aspergillus insuetus]